MSMAAAALSMVMTACPVAAEDAVARSERILGLVESLNAGSSRRDEVLGVIYNELRGENAGEMRAALKNGLVHGNMLVQIGVVEAMAMIGDVRDLYELELALEGNSRFDVRRAILRMLPAFQLWNNERARFAYIRYVNEGGRVRNPAALAPLRRPPFNRRGKLDPAQDLLRADLAEMTLAMFDPITASIGHIFDAVYGETAREGVVQYTGTSLGNDPRLWAEVWQTLAADLALANAGEIEEIRLAALATASDLGIEGIPLTIDRFAYLFSLGETLLDQSGLETLASMCRSAYDELDLLASEDYRIISGDQEKAWRERRAASAARLARFTIDESLKRIDDPALTLTAINAVGVASSFPETIPDPDGALVAGRTEAASRLALSSMSPTSSISVRRASLEALGEIGSERAVGVLEEIIRSPYASPESGRNGQDIAAAAIDALARIASGAAPGASAAGRLLLALLADGREFPPVKAGVPPTKIGHLVMWRLQRLAKTSDISLDAQFWQTRLGW